MQQHIDEFSSDIENYETVEAMIENNYKLLEETADSRKKQSMNISEILKCMNEGPEYTCCVCYTFKFARGVRRIPSTKKQRSRKPVCLLYM